MAYDPDLAERARDAIALREALREGVTKREMFGADFAASLPAK